MTIDTDYESLMTWLSKPGNEQRFEEYAQQHSELDLTWHLNRLKIAYQCLQDGVGQKEGNKSDFSVSYKRICKVIKEQGWE